MKEYSYIATQKDGKQLNGVRKANSQQELVDYLHENNLVVVSVQESIGLDFSKISQFQVGGLPLKEKMIITKQLATMVKAGVPLVQSLDVLVAQAKNRIVKEELLKVYKDVQGGMALSKSFRKNSSLYDELQTNLLEAGEKSGNLVEVLQQITVDLEKRNSLSSKIRGAMIYPVIIFLLMILVVFVMMVFMIPAVKGLYNDFGVGEDALPTVTKLIVQVSDFVTSPLGAAVLIVGVVGIVLGYRTYYSTEGGRSTIDKFFLRMPVFGPIFEYGQVVKMTRLLSMLLKSGLSIIDALTTVQKAMSNYHYKKALETAIVDVSKGSPLAVSLSKSDVIPVILIKMIAIGEDTGTVDQMLEDMSLFYETELNALADNLTKLMEPLILLVVGGIVAVLAVAIYLPIYKIAEF